MYFRIMNDAKRKSGLSEYPKPDSLVLSMNGISLVKPTGNDRYAKHPFFYNSFNVGFRGRDPLILAIRGTIHALECGRIANIVNMAYMFPSSTGPNCKALHVAMQAYAYACQALKSGVESLPGDATYSAALAAKPDFLVHAMEHVSISKVRNPTYSL